MNEGLRSMSGRKRLGRRAAVAQLLGVAATAICSSRPGKAQTTAPLREDSGRMDDLGLTLSDEQRAAGVALLRRYPSVDIHCHPGRFFLAGMPSEASAARTLGAPIVSTIRPPCLPWREATSSKTRSSATAAHRKPPMPARSAAARSLRHSERNNDQPVTLVREGIFRARRSTFGRAYERHTGSGVQ